MLINHKFEFVTGAFDTDTGKLVCVKRPKYGDVLLCWKGSANIPVGEIKLYSRDSAIDANAVFEDASAFGDEIVRRWNMVPNVKLRGADRRPSRMPGWASSPLMGTSISK